MVKFKRDEWFVTNLPEFEVDGKGQAWIINNATGSDIDINKEALPNNSISRYLENKLKEDKSL